MEEETFESCAGCWYAEHGECSLGYEPCHAGENDEQNLELTHDKHRL